MTIPEYLSDLDALKTYMRRRTDGFNTKQKGDAFAELVQYVFPLSTDFREFNQPKINSKSGSHDKGTDLFASHATLTNVKMYIQARWSIDRVDDIDSILGKFKTYAESPEGHVQQNFLSQNENKNHYMIASLDRLDSLLVAYEKQVNRPTYAFYKELKQDGRFHILDGNKILDILESEWMRYSQTIMSTELVSVNGDWLKWGNVHIGIVSGTSIVELHNNFKRSIFFDNIRDYLGHNGDNEDIDSVNIDIEKTIINNPERLLSRNNGIVIRASKVEPRSNGIYLHNMSIVNGCQTTMSIVNNSKDAGSCCVLVKVVETNDHWDITRTANLQNEVSRIELDLAQWLRPQLVERAAFQQDRPFDGDDVFAFLVSLNRSKIQYENIRAMFIGLFSGAPYNILKRDRNLIQLQLVEKVYEKDPHGANLFRVLLDLYASAQRGRERANIIFKSTENIELFSRFLDENKGFISFLAILAACTATKINISKVSRVRLEESTKMIDDFIVATESKLVNEPSIMDEFFIAAYHATTNMVSIKHATETDTSKMRQHMSTTLERVNFTTLIDQTEAMYNFRNNK
jgi:hypothetical protein